MALLLKVDPVGIDRPIDKIQQALYTGLVTNGTWTMYESYHRAYKNETKDGIVPEIFTGKKDYKDAFTDDGFTATSFFLIPNEVGVVEGQKFQAEISIIFQVDLAKLYPNAPDSRRFDEEMHNEILNILNDLDANFTDVDYVTSLDSVYAGLDTSKIKWNDLQPYHVVRFTVTANYDYQCNPVFAKAGLVCTIGVDMSKTDPTTIGGNDGTATATPTGNQGAITYQWDDPANQTTQTATGLEDGTYTCIVTDSIISIPPCDTTGMIELEDPAPICNIGVTVDVVDETSLGANDGTASATPTGGQGALTYLWTTGDGSIPGGTETNQNITGLSPGTYTVVVTDDIIPSPVCSATDNGEVVAGSSVQPDDLSNLDTWLKADEETSLNGGSINDLDPVSAWDSFSTATVNMTQGNAGKQAIWNADGFGANNMPCVTADGVKDILESTHSYSQPCTVIIVFQRDTLTVSSRIHAGTDTLGDSIGRQHTTTDMRMESDGTQLTDSNNSASTDVVILKAVYNTTSSQLGINDGAWTTGDAGSGLCTNMSLFAKPGTFPKSVTNGSIAEFVKYSDVKTDGEIQSVIAGLNVKYAIY